MELSAFLFNFALKRIIMMLKKAWIIVVLLAVLTGCSCSGDKEGGEPVAQYQSIDTVPMLIMQIQQCSRLYTTEIHVHKIVTHDDVVSIKGTLLKQDIDIKLPLGDRKIAIPMDATLKAYIDFSNFGPSNIERQGDKITIVLPDPKVEMTSSKINQKEIKEYKVMRSASMRFENVPADGSKGMKDEYMDSIEPFNFKDAVPFQTAYLSGYLADKYDVAAEDSIDTANKRIKNTTEQAFRDTVQGYSSVIRQSGNINLNNAKAKYALYPVWLLTTTYQGKQYQFAMNGQTGKFVGNMPMDKGAYWKWRLIYTGVLGAAAWIVLYLVSNFF